MNPRLRRLAWALRLRCPLCGARWRKEGPIGLARQCATCDLHVDRREHDSFLGAYVLNLFATLAVATLVVAANVRWPAAPAPLRWGIGTLAIMGCAVWFYPLSRLLWLAVDLQFRPALERDFDEEAP